MRKRYPDKSHQRRKEREAQEAREAADQSQRHVEEAAFDAIVPSNQKSSVASTEVPAGDDDALMIAPRRYLVELNGTCIMWFLTPLLQLHTVVRCIDGIIQYCDTCCSLT